MSEFLASFINSTQFNRPNRWHAWLHARRRVLVHPLTIKRLFGIVLATLVVVAVTDYFLHAQSASFYQRFGLNHAAAQASASTNGSVSNRIPLAVNSTQLPNDGTTAPLQPAASTQVSRGRYAYGECTYYVASRRFVPAGWGDARNWFYRAQAAHYATGDTPVVGAIAWTPNGWSGHVALVEAVNGDQVEVSEMNFRGWNRVDYRWTRASAWRYIY